MKSTKNTKRKYTKKHPKWKTGVAKKWKDEKRKKIVEQTEAQLKKIHAAHLRAARKERARIKAANFGMPGRMNKIEGEVRVKREDIDDSVFGLFNAPPQSYNCRSSIIGTAQESVEAGQPVTISMLGGITGIKPAPIEMLLWCPACHERHIDEHLHLMAHKTHACQKCGMQWKPANVPTRGVQFLPGSKS